jgi:hypothetical protein
MKFIASDQYFIVAGLIICVSRPLWHAAVRDLIMRGSESELPIFICLALNTFDVQSNLNTKLTCRILC